jgi:hypothetical protein
MCKPVLLLFQKVVNFPHKLHELLRVLLLGGQSRQFHPSRIISQTYLISSEAELYTLGLVELGQNRPQHISDEDPDHIDGSRNPKENFAEPTRVVTR